MTVDSKIGSILHLTVSSNRTSLSTLQVAKATCVFTHEKGLGSKTGICTNFHGNSPYFLLPSHLLASLLCYSEVMIGP
eukprot:g5565.t1